MELLRKNNVIIAFSSRKDGNMSLYYGDTKESLRNRQLFLAKLGIDYKDLVCAKQVHGNKIRYVTEKDKGRGALFYEDSFADTDGFITDRKNVPLAVFTADCLSIFLYDPFKPAIALLHCGWKSSKERIASEAVSLMQKEFRSTPHNLVVGFGSCIRDCCYEVGREFGEYFSEGLYERDGRFYLDLVAVNIKQLLLSGIDERNIFPPQGCTFCHNEEFFSFRKEGISCGRMLSVMMLS